MAMFEELITMLPNFLGKQAHICCFSHTMNLTAKGVLHPFEPVKPKARTELMSQAQVSKDIGLEELYTELRDVKENGNKETDDVEEFVEVLQEMTEEEQEQWKQHFCSKVGGRDYQRCRGQEWCVDQAGCRSQARHNCTKQLDLRQGWQEIKEFYLGCSIHFF